MDIAIQSIDESLLKPIPTGELGFGSVFSNRMFMQRFTEERGWHDATIKIYQPFSLDPATAVFHYAQEIFEGTKAYRRADGDINLFRPEENMRRFNNSAERMAMPTIDEDEHLEALMKLVELEQAWVPNIPDAALYLRPGMFATDAALGVYRSKSYLHFIILSPVGPYFSGGFSPVAVLISDGYRRAVRGGVGAAKTGGNYAASLLFSAEAETRAYSQVLWLDAIEGRFIEEVGSMNIFLVYGGERIVTPPLTGSILAGVTRKSILELGLDLGFSVTEELIDVHEMLADIQSGNITEVFGCGTAAVVAPIGKFGFRDDEYIVGNGQSGPISTRLYQELTDVQYGRVVDRFGWTKTIQVI